MAAAAAAASTPTSDPAVRSSAQIRKEFNDFFTEKHGHTFWPSSSTIPHNDPTLLFANAGMNQYKALFLNTVDRNSPMGKLKRACNSQKCIRAGGKHNDLDDVGKDVYHHTFFEMLGNWSFGDFFKIEAIEWSWELLTKVWGINPEHLYVTYFEGDEADGVPCDTEARDKWLTILPPERVLPGNKADNFWEMGETGPCGPCSEIHFDRNGRANSAAAHLVNQDDPDVLEIWNLVFMQFDRSVDGLVPLPAHHIDTGLGLERIVSVLQQKKSNYATDLFMPIFEAMEQLCSSRPYTDKVGDDDVDGIDTAYRVVADHVRTLTIALTDGGVPDRDGRGYVLRLILRRAIRFINKYFPTAPPYLLTELVPVVDASLGDFFPELRAEGNYDRINAILREEEDAFRTTLDRGETYFKRLTMKLKEGDQLPGADAWMLYETYGFPVDLTRVMAEERKLKIDEEAFIKAKLAHIETSKKGGKKGGSNIIDLDVHAISELEKRGVVPTDDDPKYNYQCTDKDVYSFAPITGKVLALRIKSDDDKDVFVDTVDASSGPISVGVVLDRTCFYAESGGQIYDTGTMTASEEVFATISNTQKRGPYCIHVGFLESGKLGLGDELVLNIDEQKRRPTMSNHTATHMLNYGLRKVMEQRKPAQQADQQGSLVTPERLRFDFSCKGSMTEKEIIETEMHVRELIARNAPTFINNAPLGQAKAIAGLRAMFGETYPDPVRVVSLGVAVDELLANPTSDASLTTSIEFCGGTHVLNTGDIGDFIIVSEDAIAKGKRRIVAMTGKAASDAIAVAARLKSTIRGDMTLKEIITHTDKVNKATIPHVAKLQLRDELEVLKKKLKVAQKAKQQERQKELMDRADTLVAAGSMGHLVVQIVEGVTNPKSINQYVGKLSGASPDTAFFIIGVDDTVTCFASVPKSMTTKVGLKANEWVKSVQDILKGKGGGRDNTAQCSGTAVEKVETAKIIVENYAKGKLGMTVDM